MGSATFVEKLRFVEFNSSFARSLLSSVYKEGRRYRIPFGPLAGKTLEYDSSVNFHVMLGLWESKSYAFLGKLFRQPDVLPSGAVVVDMGANLGYFSLWMDQLLADKNGHVLAFEPSPSVLPMLRHNLEDNRAGRVRLIEQACSDRDGTVDFFVGDHHHISSLNEAWAAQGKGGDRRITVKSTTLDSFFYGKDQSELTGPNFIKIDIEGGGVFALQGVDTCLQRKRPFVWMESHTPAEDRAISDLILRNDYQAYRLQTRSVVHHRNEVHPHADGVWGTLLLYPTERAHVLQSVLK